jgi:hypothetical protein
MIHFTQPFFPTFLRTLSMGNMDTGKYGQQEHLPKLGRSLARSINREKNFAENPEICPKVVFCFCPEGRILEYMAAAFSAFRGSISAFLCASPAEPIVFYRTGCGGKPLSLNYREASMQVLEPAKLRRGLAKSINRAIKICRKPWNFPCLYIFFLIGKTYFGIYGSGISSFPIFAFLWQNLAERVVPV